ncbi:hypothetical protein ACFLR1_01095 [Bacteroidota bacterium]
MKFIDIPQVRTLKDYSYSIDEMASRVQKLEGVVSIYQIGSVSNPGMSDIDMLVVFDDEASIPSDPVRDFSPDTYLFTHQLYGVPKSRWEDLRAYTFFHNYRFISGQELPEQRTVLAVADERALKVQIALEFLVKMFVVLTVQLKYDIVKLRSFLLEGKALIYDLEFLGIDSGELFRLVNQVIEMRAEWWQRKPSDKELSTLIKDLYHELTTLLQTEFSKNPLFLPLTESFKIARNIQISNGEFSANSSAIVFPNFGILNEKKHFNLLNRFSNFSFTFPYKMPEADSVIEKRFKLLSELRSHNNKNLPGFLIPASSLKVV